MKLLNNCLNDRIIKVMVIDRYIIELEDFYLLRSIEHNNSRDRINVKHCLIDRITFV